MKLQDLLLALAHQLAELGPGVSGCRAQGSRAGVKLRMWVVFLIISCNSGVFL